MTASLLSTRRETVMTRISRLSINQLFFSTIPGQRVTEIEAALSQQRTHLRTAPAGSIDEDAAERNIVDLEGVLARAEANLAAHTAHLAQLAAAEAAKRQENDDQALAAITDQLRSNYLAQPGTTVKEFEKVLPRLLERQREDAALNAPAVREQQLAAQRRRIGSF